MGDCLLSALQSSYEFVQQWERQTKKFTAPGFCYPDGTGSVRMDGWMLCKVKKLDNQRLFCCIIKDKYN